MVFLTVFPLGDGRRARPGMAGANGLSALLLPLWHGLVAARSGCYDYSA